MEKRGEKRGREERMAACQRGKGGGSCLHERKKEKG
jgi:hypothetical protein